MDEAILTSPAFAYFILAVVIWTIPWKAVALWKAARNKDLVWFIIILLFNTLAILEIIYIFIIQKKKSDKS